MKEKSQVADIDRSVYDIRDKEDDAYRMQEGLTPEIIDKLSKEKDDPVWMQQFRLQSLQIYNEMPVPDWGPSIEGLDMDHIATYVRPKTDMKNDWKDVPQDIKDTFERLGIPQVVLSSSEQSQLERLLKHYEIDGYFDSVLGADNLLAGSKVERAEKFIEEHGVDASKAVVVGDLLHDCDVAKAIGSQCLLITSGHHDRARLESAGVRVEDTLKSFVEEN